MQSLKGHRWKDCTFPLYQLCISQWHHMSVMMSQILENRLFCQQIFRPATKKTLLDLEKGILWCSVDYPHKVPFKRNTSPCHDVTMNHATRVCGWKTNYRHMLKLLRTTVIYSFSGNLQQTITYNSFTWLCELHHVFTVQYVLKMWWKCLKSFW